jgi:hypothetical protein
MFVRRQVEKNTGQYPDKHAFAGHRTPVLVDADADELGSLNTS